MKNNRNYLFGIMLLFILYSCQSVQERELEKGKNAFEKGDYHTTIEYCKKVFKENNNHPEACLLLGRAYLEVGGTFAINDAIYYIEKSIKINPSNSEAYVFLGDAFNQQLSSSLSHSEVVEALTSEIMPVSDKAIENYQKAINIDSNNALPYYRMGHLYGFSKKDFDQGIEWYKKGLAKNDNYTRIYFNLGMLYTKNADIDNAINSYKESINKEPYLLDSYLELSKVLLTKNLSNEAINYLNILLDKDPNYKEVNYYLGLANQNINKNKSLEYFKTAARLGDSDAKEYLNEKKIKW